MNRLNATFDEMLAFERDLTRSGRRVAILFYGDHHPTFAKNLVPPSGHDPQIDLRQLTMYRFAKSYGSASGHARATLSIEELSERFLTFAGLPRPAEMTVIRALRDRCGAPDVKCPPAIKSAIGAAILQQ